MNCREISRVLSEYVDRDATPEERARIEDHLRLCPSCQVKVSTMTTTIVLMSRLGGGCAEREMVVRLRRRILRIDRG
jgi:predicted anti-sigma-YlaC factor YlaD